MVVAVAYELEIETDKCGVGVSFTSILNIVGVADVTDVAEYGGYIVNAMRKQYGDIVEVAIITVDNLEVEQWNS